MTDTHTINVATEFSKYPGGRFVTDGDYSGERFREEYLVPALQANTTVTLELDGTLGYGSSFLEEAFGGLVREAGFSKEKLRQSLQIVTTNDILQSTIFSYINEAKANRLVK